MIIYLASDHNGLELKGYLLNFLQMGGYSVEDVGDKKLNPEDDFPVFASKAVNAIKNSPEDADPRGILICGSGQGMCMAANRFEGIRAALCWNITEARSARNDDNSNVLCLSASSTSTKEAEAIVNAWLNTPFAAATRFIRRLKQLDDLS
jgi:ribose 5-phosphate isomerase B